jgi:hypothetical protein
VDNIIDEVKKR